MRLTALGTPADTCVPAVRLYQPAKADSFQGFQNGASSESCSSASATGPMHDAQCGLVLRAKLVQLALGCIRSGYGAVVGECFMVGFDEAQIVEVVDHEPG